MLIRNKRTVFIGDVHGCLRELESLLAKISPRAGDDIILLGDLVNRGPDSAAVVDLVRRSGWTALKGNHEDEYIRHSTTHPAFMRMREEMGETNHEWLDANPYYIETEKYICVHAGKIPGQALAQSNKEALLNIRTWDGVGRDLSNPANPPWYDFYHDRKPIFYGHWARRGLNLRHNTKGLDSGCVYGKQLSAWVFETEELLQVEAAQVYCQPKGT